MADFLLSEAVEEDPTTNDEEDEGNIVTLSDEEFIDDSNVYEQNPSDYYGFTNVTREYDDAIQDSFEDFDYISQEASNYNSEISDLPPRIDDFKDFEYRVKKFKNTLFNPHGLNNENSFFYSILYAVRYYLTKKCDLVEDEQIKVDIGGKIYDKIHPLKGFFQLNLDIFTFENQCQTINQILSDNKLFLRVYELKDKFRYLTEDTADNKKIIRELSSCINEKFNGFNIVRIEFDQKIRQNFSPIDILYKPVKKEDEIIDCFFTDKMSLAYRTTYSTGNEKKLEHGCAFRCHFCSKFFCRKASFDRHLEICSGKPGFIYNFDTQNLLTFEENLKLKHDIPLTAYIDFETTAPTDDMLDPESNKKNVVSYAIIFAFHPKLKMKSIIIERSFGHSIQKLTTIEYLTTEQLKFKDAITLQQLRDCAIAVSSRKKCNAIAEMFSTDLKFASDCLLKWFYSKNKKNEVSLQERRDYKIKNPIDWENGKCQICTFPFNANPSDTVKENDKMSYGDFIIQKKHKFLRNIFSKENLKKSEVIKNLESFPEHFSKYLRLTVYAEKCLTSLKEFSDCCYEELNEFILENCEDCNDFNDLKEKNLETEVKSKQKSVIPNFNLKLYAFFYQKVMCFPTTDFECDTVATNNLFESVHKLLSVKIHLHHSHVTGEIIGYTHDVCNCIVNENKGVVSCIAHNFFKFDFYFLLKNIRLSVSSTKDINIGGKNLADINFVTIDNFKFIDTIKYYQTSLVQLSETLSDDEKENVEKLIVQFLTTHDYFSTVWRTLTLHQKSRVIELLLVGRVLYLMKKLKPSNLCCLLNLKTVFFFER